MSKDITYRLDLIDRKILYELDHNSRQSATHIAKKCLVHRNVINFRINRLVERGIIRKFVTIIGPQALGFTPYKFYLQLQNLTLEKEKEIERLISSLPVYWAAKVSGRWDYIIGVMVTDGLKLKAIKDRILSTVGPDIINRSQSMLVEAPHYYRSYLLNKKGVSPTKYWIKNCKKVPLMDKDLQILKLLAQDARYPATKISQKTKLSLKTVIRHISELKKSGVIYDFRISLNLDKIGYKFFKCFITLKSYNQQRLNQFFEYCRVHPNIIHVVECVGQWDIEPEFELQSEQDFQTLIAEIRSKFNDIIGGVETINILKEYEYVCLPESKSL